MPNRSSIPWRLKAVACLASATLSVALVAVFTAPFYLCAAEARSAQPVCSA